MSKLVQMSRGIVSVYDDTVQFCDAWLPNTAYVIGDHVYNWDPTAVGHLPIQVYECTTGGTSGNTGGPIGVGTGISDGVTVKWKSLTPRKLGVVSQMKLSFESTNKEHYDWSAPTAQLDATAEDRRKASIQLTMDEFSLENIALALRGVIVEDAGPPAKQYVEVGAAGRQNNCFMFQGTNATGPRFQVLVPRASLLPADSRDLISEDFNKQACKGDVYYAPGKGGFWQEVVIS